MKAETDGTIFQFILGSHSYEGKWFSDMVDGSARFWWRKILREIIVRYVTD
jgi:hypothetical protein